MNTTQKDLSYYKLRLQQLISTSFPELRSDTAFINRRAQLAADAYEQTFIAGNTIDECDYAAEELLFKGLHFSKFDTLFNIVCNEFDMLMMDEELQPFAHKMMNVCKPVFAQYALNDDFPDSPEYSLMYTELRSNIQTWIDENGLQ